MRISFIALLWFAIGVSPAIGGFEFTSHHFSGSTSDVQGATTSISADGGTLSVPDGDD